MNKDDLVQQRLRNQKLSSSHFEQPVEVVRWLGAMQAQDFGAAKWALALRMRKATNTAIEEAFNQGQILRTHLLRPTWHFVAPEDIRWLLELTAPRVNIRCGPNYRKYELDSATFKRSNKVLTRALQGGKHLTRFELKAVLNRSGVAADDIIRLAHILIRAELDGVVCSGPRIGKQFTYALLEERVPPTKRLGRDEALAKLTQCYFASHGPATLQDFVWWSGLTAGDTRKGIALSESQLDKVLVNERVYWINRDTDRAVNSKLSQQSAAHLLPAYDEYNVAYKDRDPVLDHNSSMTTWAMLGPTIMIDGRILGTWKPVIDKTPTIALKPARALTKPEKLAVVRAVARYADFSRLKGARLLYERR